LCRFLRQAPRQYNQRMQSTDQRNITRVTAALMIAQSLSSAAYSSSVAVNQFAIVEMTGRKTLGGLPSALVLAGSAVMAVVAGRMVARHGRRNVLTMGTALGFAGGLIAGGGVLIQSLPLFVLGLLVLGLGRGTLDQSRYVAAEVNPPDRRARALSFVVWAATIGAVGGPLLAPYTDTLGQALGMHPYAGPLFSTGLFYGIAGIVIFALLALDLKGLAARVAATNAKANPAAQAAATTNRSFGEVFRTVPAARAALVTMAAGQTAMALMMTCIAIHMKDHGHTIGNVSTVIAMHTLGMFAFSPLVGQLADRYGRRPVILGGVVIAATGALLVPISLNLPLIAFAEFLVGLGWSGCYVAGSALLTEALGLAERARLQGANDSLVNVGSALGSLGSGPLLQLIGIWPLAFVGMFIASLPVWFVLGLKAIAKADSAAVLKPGEA
jgi:MFS family permease